MIKNIHNAEVKRPPEGVSLDLLLPHSGGNIFRLVRLAMLRALELNAGRPPLVNHPSSDKATSIALEEIAQGKVFCGKIEKSKKVTQRN